MTDAVPMIPCCLAMVSALCLGCHVPSDPHPAIGRPVRPLPIVSVTDASRAAPSFEGKITLLNFWATWCPPCRRELPGLARLAKRLADEPRFQLVAIACDDEDEPGSLAPTIGRFLTGQRLDLDAWIDPDRTAQALVGREYGFRSLPTTYLVGPDGRVQQVWVGYSSWVESDMARAVVAALKVPTTRTEGTPAAR